MWNDDDFLTDLRGASVTAAVCAFSETNREPKLKKKHLYSIINLKKLLHL